jgi:surface polysaccharide O-acyltransferase-like enzyme
MPLYTNAPDSAIFAYANLLDSLSRFCVPLFFMASGAVLLGRDYDIAEFYRKRLTKIIPVLLFWSAVYLALRVFVKGEPFEPIRAVMMFFGGHIYYHLWFLYVIVILYMLTPFMRKLILAMNDKEAFVLLVLWLAVAVVLPHIENVSGMKFNFVYREIGAYSGYFVLGYYLSRTHFSKPLLAFLVFTASSAAIFYLTGAMSVQKGELYGAFYDYSSPLVLIQGVSMFLIFKAFEDAKAFEYVAKLSPLVFGVYLLHPILLEYSGFIDDLALKALIVFTSSLIAVKALCVSGFRRVL